MQTLILFALICIFITSAFITQPLNRIASSKTNLNARKKNIELITEIKHEVGVDIPEEIAKQNAIYDMILVERYSTPLKTDFGLFLPKIEGKDQKHLG